MYLPVTVSHPPVKMSSLNPCIVLGHIIKAYVCMEGSQLPRDCSGRKVTVQCTGRNTESITSFVTALS